MENNTFKTVKNGSPSFFQDETCHTWPVYFDALTHIESFFIILTNIFVAMIIVRQKEIRSKHSSKLFLSLQVTHIALASTLIAFTHVTWNKHALRISNSLLFHMFLTLVMKSLDRWTFIQYPYWYEMLTGRRVSYIIFTSWIISALFFGISLLVDMHQRMLMIISSCLIIFSTLVLGSCNTSIYFIVQRHRKSIQRTCITGETGDIGTVRNEPKQKSAYACFALVTSFIILWCPYLIHNIVSLSGVFVAASCHTASQTVIIIAQINSFVDPLLFSLFNRDVKREITKFGSSQNRDRENREDTNNVATVFITTNT